MIEQSGSKGFFLKCPQQGCDKEASQELIKSCTSEALFQKYLKFQVEKIVMSDDKKKFCPNPKCESIVVEAPSKDAMKVMC